MPNLGQIRRFLELCDLEIWRMTLKNNRAPLLCCRQLCAWFHCHMLIQTGVKSPETAKLGVDLCDLDLWPLTLTFSMDITSDHGNNCWKFRDDTMMGTWWKRCDGQTDRQTDGLNQSYSCLVAAKNNRDPNQGVLHLWSKFGDPSLNGWWVIVRTSLWLIHTHTHTHRPTDAGDDNTRRPKLASGKNYKKCKYI